ncbi:MAG TPA: metalloregulator ArsR/SmtB family transcription factor [Caulobacteraceae bacterium]|nr:metalloregulator ArsR/SmtB family transcription factor [Caulobacteraceae bacterium]
MSRAIRELDEIDAVFNALAHATRRHILIVLNARGGRVPAGDIAARFSCSWPTTSRHLRVLQAAGLVTVEREGRGWLYVLDRARLATVGARWFEWFNLEEEAHGETSHRVRAV